MSLSEANQKKDTNMMGLLLWEEEKENALEIFTFYGIQEVWHASKTAAVININSRY